RISVETRQWDLYLRQTNQQYKIILRPPDKITLSFRVPQKTRSVRLTPNGGTPISQFATEGAISFSCDGFYFPSTNTAWRFSGPEFTLYDGDTGAIKVNFTKNSDTLIIESLDAPPSLQRPINLKTGRTFWENFREYLFSLMDGRISHDRPIPKPTTDDDSEWQAHTALSAILGQPVSPPQGIQPPIWVSRFYQSMPVRPMDLFRVQKIPTVLITHTRLANQPAALLCLTNPMPHHRSLRINLAELGLNPNYPWTLFDLIKLRYLSAATGALAVTLSPYETRLYLMRRFMARPQVVGNDLRVWELILCGLQETWDAGKGALRISFSTPPETKEGSLFVASAFDQGIWKPINASRNSELVPLYPNLGSWRILLPPAKANSATFQHPILIQFAKEKAELLSAPELGIGPGSPWAITLTRQTIPNDPYAGFYVFRNGTLIGYFTDIAFLDDEVDPACDYSYTVFGVGYSADPSLPKTTFIHTPTPTDIPLTHLFPSAWAPPLYVPQKNTAPDGKALSFRGEPTAGWGIPSGGMLSFRLSRAFESLSGTVSPLSGWEGEEPLIFEAYGDGKLLFRSKPLYKGEAETFEIDVYEIHLLELRVIGDSQESFGLWTNLFLKAKRSLP
ncbi:MAG: NPCBM/NEW2 domain-containing protein, partial [Candidatus Caldarchaeum sp.]